MTDEESQLLLTYVSETNFPGGVDPAKFLMATSILYGDACPQNASGPLALTLAETVVKQIFNLQDNCILEATLCLLWTLCHTPAIVQRLSQIDHLILELKTMQQTRCSTVSSLVKCVLWKLGCGKYEGKISLCCIFYYAINNKFIYLCILTVMFYTTFVLLNLEQLHLCASVVS